MNSDTVYHTISLQFFAQLAQQVIGEVILHDIFTSPYVSNVTDWEHLTLNIFLKQQTRNEIAIVKAERVTS